MIRLALLAKLSLPPLPKKNMKWRPSGISCYCQCSSPCQAWWKSLSRGGQAWQRVRPEWTTPCTAPTWHLALRGEAPTPVLHRHHCCQSPPPVPLYPHCRHLPRLTQWWWAAGLDHCPGVGWGQLGGELFWCCYKLWCIAFIESSSNKLVLDWTVVFCFKVQYILEWKMVCWTKRRYRMLDGLVFTVPDDRKKRKGGF